MHRPLALALATALAMCVFTQRSLAAEVDLLDFLVDGEDMIGQIETVRGCYLMFASADTITCSSLSDPDSYGTRHIRGSVLIDSHTVDRPGLRAALQRCPGSDIKNQCAATVTGLVHSPFRDLGVEGDTTLGLKNATIAFTGG